MEKELEEEFEFHLEHLTEEYLAQGASPEEAHKAAVREMGGFEQRKEECRDLRGRRWFDELQKDLRYGLSRLIRQPVFMAATILILTLGISINSLMFNLVNSILFRPLGISEPNRLVHMYETAPEGGPQYGDFKYSAYEVIRIDCSCLLP